MQIAVPNSSSSWFATGATGTITGTSNKAGNKIAVTITYSI